MHTVTARIDADTKSRLEKLAATTARSRSWLVAEAIKQYIDTQAWQIEAIEEGVRQADAGAFASKEEVTKGFAHWGVHVK